MDSDNIGPIQDRVLHCLSGELKPVRTIAIAKSLGFNTAKEVNPTLYAMLKSGLLKKIDGTPPLWEVEKYLPRSSVNTADTEMMENVQQESEPPNMANEGLQMSTIDARTLENLDQGNECVGIGAHDTQATPETLSNQDMVININEPGVSNSPVPTEDAMKDHSASVRSGQSSNMDKADYVYTMSDCIAQATVEAASLQVSEEVDESYNLHPGSSSNSTHIGDGGQGASYSCATPQVIEISPTAQAELPSDMDMMKVLHKLQRMPDNAASSLDLCQILGQSESDTMAFLSYMAKYGYIEEHSNKFMKVPKWHLRKIGTIVYIFFIWMYQMMF